MMLIFFIIVAVFQLSISHSSCSCLDGNFIQSVTIEEGQSVKLECYIGGETNVSIKWHREPFKNSVNQNITLPNGEETYYGNILELPSITRHQRGIYVCSVNDQSGNASRYYRVTVNFKPIVIETLRIDRYESNRIELRCAVESEPPAEIYWVKNNQRVSSNNYITNITKREFDDTLNSTLIDLEDNDGYRVVNYDCVILNSLANFTMRFGSTHVKYPYTEFSRYTILNN